MFTEKMDNVVLLKNHVNDLLQLSLHTYVYITSFTPSEGVTLCFHSPDFPLLSLCGLLSGLSSGLYPMDLFGNPIELAISATI